MSSFRDELNRVAISKNTSCEEISKLIESYIAETIDETIVSICASIKSDIIQKSKSAQYETAGSYKYITGFTRVWTAYYRKDFSKYKAVLRTMDDREIRDKYMKQHPNMHLSYDKDRETYTMGYTLVKRIEHSPFFGKRYYTYHLTDVAKQIIAGIIRKSAEDDIKVEFSHILLDIGSHTMKLPDGGDDRKFTGIHGSDGILMVKYSINF